MPVDLASEQRPLRGDDVGAVEVDDGEADRARGHGVEGEATEAVGGLLAHDWSSLRQQLHGVRRRAGRADRRCGGTASSTTITSISIPGARNVSWRAVSSLRTPVSSAAESKTSSASSWSMVRQVHAALAPFDDSIRYRVGGAERPAHQRRADRRRTRTSETFLGIEAGRQELLQALEAAGPGRADAADRDGRASRRWSGSRSAAPRTAGASAAGPRGTAWRRPRARRGAWRRRPPAPRSTGRSAR